MNGFLRIFFEGMVKTLSAIPHNDRVIISKDAFTLASRFRLQLLTFVRNWVANRVFTFQLCM